MSEQCTVHSAATDNFGFECNHILKNNRTVNYTESFYNVVPSSRGEDITGQKIFSADEPTQSNDDVRGTQFSQSAISIQLYEQRYSRMTEEKLDDTWV
jgi:hypothetical protein